MLNEAERRRLIDDERTTETKAHRCRVFVKKNFGHKECRAKE